MKTAIIGTSGMTVPDLEEYVPPQTTEIVSGGGANGVDISVKEYATAHDIKLTEFLPDHDTYGDSAPLQRNIAMIHYADIVLAFWDGESNETQNIIDKCKELDIPIRVFV